MRKQVIVLLVAFFSILSVLVVSAQQQNSAYRTYINQYAPLAQQQMVRHGIPASITLAQGLLESAAGNSTLAQKANNHFGIKVTSDWNGRYILRDDDKPNEKFRVYSSVAESYEDHSLFLKRPRYQSLFRLSTTDYKGWANGLKACGYATNPAYATSLINLIELYQLCQYDNANQQHLVQNGCSAVEYVSGAVAVPQNSTSSGIEDIIHFCNGSRYVIARQGDTWEKLSLYYNVRARKLRHRNELPSYVKVAAGDIVYLDSKKSRAAKAMKHKYHTVKVGESMHLISQQYGVKMKTLYSVNQLGKGYMPRPGDQLRIR